jgi:hypothetical protein
VDHLARRRGLTYAAKEWRFLLACGRQRTLSWPRVMLLALLRCPVRLVPARLQQWLTEGLLRVGPSQPTGIPDSKMGKRKTILAKNKFTL